MNRLALCLAIASLALAACGSEPDPDAAAAGPKPAAKPAAPDDPTLRMAQAVGNGKPGSLSEKLRQSYLEYAQERGAS